MKKSTGIRIALVASFIAVNALVLGATSMKVKKDCTSDCVIVPGGAVGHHADCVQGTTISNCQPDGIDTCRGFPCADSYEFETVATTVYNLFTAR